MLSAMKPRSPVGEAIGQRRPFRTPRQEGVVALLVAADAVKRVFVDLLARRGEVTLQQYNVLRILRGAGRQGLPTLEIAGRMMERTPGVSRLTMRDNEISGHPDAAIVDESGDPSNQLQAV